MFATGNAVFLGLAAPVGGAVAGVVLVAIVIIIACYVIRRNKRSEKDMRAFSGNSNANALSNISSQVRINFEPVHKKTNNLGSDQVRHKLGCAVTEDG